MTSKVDHEARERVKRIVLESRDLEPQKRLEVLNTELEAAVAERKLMLTESLSLLFGSGSSSLDFIGEDPRFDDGEVWDEVGFHRGQLRRRNRRRLTRQDLDNAREIGRWLAEENEYVIGSMTNRVSYTVGEGLIWRAVPVDRMAEDRGMTEAANETLEEFREQELMDIVEQEWVWRQDRDGEALLRIFANADGPPQVRFMEPETLAPPAVLTGERGPRGVYAASLGVDTSAQDVRDVRGYWVQESDLTDPSYVTVDTGMGIRHVHHAKLNTDLWQPRGWPTYWPIRKNMARSEKLIRNMSFVAALQAAIALVRKHDTKGQSEIESFLDRHKDLTVTNRVTGKDTRFRGVGPGTVIDSGPGHSYEAPISSVNASNNMPVHAADLRAGAAAVVQPEFMFSGDAQSGYASLLVAEGPPHKNFRRLQSRNKRPLRAIHWDALKHEVFWGRLDPRILERYRLEVDFPEVQVRDRLQETQRNQILFTGGAMSRHTWRAREGLTPDEEDRHLDREAAAGMSDPRQGQAAGAAPPPAGSTPGGPGGADMRGDPESPETAPVTRFDRFR